MASRNAVISYAHTRGRFKCYLNPLFWLKPLKAFALIGLFYAIEIGQHLIYRASPMPRRRDDDKLLQSKRYAKGGAKNFNLISDS